MGHEKSLDAYLKPSAYLDYLDPQIQAVILSLNQKASTEVDRIRAAFEFVRDEIGHSFDIQNREVTRGMNIPSGISYQNLTLYEKPEDGYCIHALNTVYLKDLDKWIRLDARGNKEGINAQFSIEEEKLAFPIREQYGEWDYLTNYDEPHPEIISTLEKHNDCIEMYQMGLPEELI